MLDIPEEKWKHAHRLLQCLVVSSRPLRVEELAEILSIQFDSGTKLGLITGWRPENTEDTVLSVCSSLIAIVEIEGSPVVQFSHFSVEEFLTSNRLATAQMGKLSRYHIALEPAHEILAQACLSTLLELDEHIDKKGLKEYPLAFYAARHWFEHVWPLDVPESLWIKEAMRQLFDGGKPQFLAWMWIFESICERGQTMEDLAERPSKPQATPLFYSVSVGLRSVSEQLISLHPNDVNPPENRTMAPLWPAVDDGYIDIAGLLLQHGANPNYAFDQDNWTLLHLASSDGSNEIIQLLLKYGADANPSDAAGLSPLQEASRRGHVGAIQLLLEHGANLNHHEFKFGRTPLILAVQGGHIEALRLLLQHHADVDGKDNDGRTALHWALSNEDYGVAQLLLEHGANVDLHEPTSGPNMLIDAVQGGRVEALRLLLQHNADVDGKDNGGSTALHWAFANEDDGIVQVLLEHGANVNLHEPDFGRTPLIIAVQWGRVEASRLLLQHNADVNGKENNGRTALHWALINEDDDAVQLLLEHGAEVHHRESEKGRTPLILAVQNGRVDIVRLLLQHNADIEAKDLAGQRALHWTNSNGNIKVVRALLERGADVHARDYFDRTTLEIGLRTGCRDIVPLLLEYGARTEENVPTLVSTP